MIKYPILISFIVIYFYIMPIGLLPYNLLNITLVPSIV